MQQKGKVNTAGFLWHSNIPAMLWLTHCLGLLLSICVGVFVHSLSSAPVYYISSAFWQPMISQCLHQGCFIKTPANLKWLPMTKAEEMWLFWECNSVLNKGKEYSTNQGFNSLYILVYNSTHFTLHLHPCLLLGMEAHTCKVYLGPWRVLHCKTAQSKSQQQV